MASFGNYELQKSRSVADVAGIVIENIHDSETAEVWTNEEAQQIRRSSKSVRSNIVEGYGRRYYKGDYLKFLIYSLASNDETLDHLEMLFETKSLTDSSLFEELHKKVKLLSRKLQTFIRGVNENHVPPPL